MPEEFIQFLWEQRLFHSSRLTTISGEPVEVMETGMRNHDAGPDFFNARVRIGETTWAGNIEIHKNASDWFRHHHQDDKSYDNIILHVVICCDRRITRESGEEIPTLELPFPAHLLVNYRQLMESQSWIPCMGKIRFMDTLLLGIGFNRLMIERLQEKTGEILQILARNNQDWNETLYQMMARSFGCKINALPFDMLARSLPSTVWGKHRDQLFQLEALFFGQSGMLHEDLLGDDYFLQLRAEYDFLARKYHLRPMAAHLWKFARLRPVNFPTIRISQFASLVHQRTAWLPGIIETSDLHIIRQMFDAKASDYWNWHYRFNFPSKECLKHLGDMTVDGLIVNTLIPFLFVYGEHSGKNYLKDRALNWLDQLRPEVNSIIEGWGSLGISVRSAFETQALLQLKKRYCDQRKCLDCYIGSRIIRQEDLDQ